MDFEGYKWIHSHVTHVGRNQDTGVICSVMWQERFMDPDAGGVNLDDPIVDIKVGDPISLYTAGVSTPVRWVVGGVKMSAHSLMRAWAGAIGWGSNEVRTATEANILVWRADAPLDTSALPAGALFTPRSSTGNSVMRGHD